MKRFFKFIPVALAAVALTGCSNDDLFSSENAQNVNVGTNEAYATIDFGGETTTRSGIVLGTGANEGKMAITWTQGDKFNLYSKNSLKFNTYTVKSGFGTPSGTFETTKDNLNLTEVTDEEAENFFAVIDDSGKGLVHSFFTDEDGKAKVSIEIPNTIEQNAGAAYTDAKKASQLCLPAYADNITVNAAGGVKASFKPMCGLMAIDAGKLSTNARGIVVVAKNISGTFEADLEDNPSIADADGRYTHGNYIFVKFNEGAVNGARFIYVPVPAGTYQYMNVFEVTHTAALTTITSVTGETTATPTVTPAVGTATQIICEPNYKVVKGQNTIAQGITIDATACTNWVQISKKLYDEMDGKHAITLDIDDPSAFTDAKLYIPVNAEKKTSNLEISVKNTATKLSASDALTIVEAVYNAESDSWSEETSATSVSAAAVKNVALTINSNVSSAVNAYLPTSTFTVGAASTTALSGLVTALTATEGVFVAGEGTIATLTTVPTKSTGAITVASGTVTTLTPTAGDGAVAIYGNVGTMTIANMNHTAGVTIGEGGNVTTSLTYAADADANRNSGDIVVEKGGNVTTLTNNGSGKVTVNGSVGTLANVTKSGAILVDGGAVTTALTDNSDNELIIKNIAANCGTITNAKKAITITGYESTAHVFTIGAITQNASADLTIQNFGKATTTTPAFAGSEATQMVGDITGKYAKVILKDIIGTVKSLTLTNDAAVTATNVTAVTDLNDNAKKLTATVTDTHIATLSGSNTGSVVNAYGSSIGTFSNTGAKVNAYWMGSTKNAVVADADATIYTAAQIALLTKAHTYTIGTQVNAIDFKGGDGKKWKGAVNAGNFSLNGNNVPMVSLQLDNNNNGVGLVAKTTGTATFTNINLSDVYYNGTSNNVGVLIGSAAGVSTTAVKIADASINTTGYNIGSIAGLTSGASTITSADIQMAKVGGAYNIGGIFGTNTGNVTVTAADVDVDTYAVNATIDEETSENTKFGSVGNIVGYVQSNVTITAAANCNTTYDLTKQANWETLKFKGNWKMSAGQIKRYYYGANQYVGWVLGGTITVDGAALGTASYNGYKEW